MRSLGSAKVASQRLALTAGRVIGAAVPSCSRSSAPPREPSARRRATRLTGAAPPPPAQPAGPVHEVRLNYRGVPLPQRTTVRLLGVHLDEQLTYAPHLALVEAAIAERTAELSLGPEQVLH